MKHTVAYSKATGRYVMVRTADNVILTWDHPEWMMVECVPGSATDTDFEEHGDNIVMFFQREWAEVAVQAIALREQYIASLRALVEEKVSVSVI